MKRNPLHNPGDRPDYTEDIQIAGSDIDVPISIDAQTVTLDINIETCAVTINVDIVAQTVGNLEIDIAAQSVGNLDIDIAAQTLSQLNINIKAQAIDIDINLEGPTGGYAVEVTSDFSIYSQLYSRRAQSTTGTSQAISADARYTLTNSTHFYNPVLEVYSSAAAKMTVECMRGVNYYTVGVFYMAAGEYRIWRITDLEGSPLGSWLWGNVYVTPDADTTMLVLISHCP